MDYMDHIGSYLLQTGCRCSTFLQTFSPDFSPFFFFLFASFAY